MRPSPFFIVGSQRSGTTLMRLVLDCHPQIDCHDERTSYELLAAGHDVNPAGARLLGLKVPQLTEQFGDAYLRDDAAVRAAGTGVPNHYRGHRLIFMIRDVRDTVASMLSLKGWLAKWGGTVLDARIQHDDAFVSRYRAEIDYVRASPFQDVVRAALIWRYKMDALFDYVQNDYPVLPVRYETLVASPEPTLRRVCAFLDVPWEDALLHHGSVRHRELWTNGMAIGDTNPARAIDTTSIGQWQRLFTDDEIDHMLHVAGRTQAQLYPSNGAQ